MVKQMAALLFRTPLGTIYHDIMRDRGPTDWHRADGLFENLTERDWINADSERITIGDRKTLTTLVEEICSKEFDDRVLLGANAITHDLSPRRSFCP